MGGGAAPAEGADPLARLESAVDEVIALSLTARSDAEVLI
jgi:hypothetical protein